MMKQWMAMLVLAVGGAHATALAVEPPIVDVHFHALKANHQGPPPLAFCLPSEQWPAHDPATPYPQAFMGWMKAPQNAIPGCDQPAWSPETDEDLMLRTLEIAERRNIIGITSGSMTAEYRARKPGRIIPGIMFSAGRNPPPVDELRARIEAGEIAVLGEITNQYDGIMPGDPRFAPYLALAEELDVPMGIHVGPGPPGAPYLGMANYRARWHSPLIFEDMLIKHPRLRIYMMHAGWPMLDDMLAVMYAHPQVHVGLGVISFAVPRAEFHHYLQRLVNAGFGKRIMFGSDHMVWPEALEYAIESVESAEFLSEAQKRDILYNNAARFFRFSEAEIDRHHGRDGGSD